MLGGEGSVSRRITPRGSESRRRGLGGSSSRNGARRESGTGHGKLPEEGEEEDASSAVASSPPGVSLSSVGGQSEFREEEPSEESQLSSEEPEGSLSQPAKRTTPTSPSKGKKQGATISKGSGGKVRKKTAGTGRVKVKLWRPRHVKRTGKDLHELDICLTVYDEIVREAL